LNVLAGDLGADLAKLTVDNEEFLDDVALRFGVTSGTIRKILQGRVLAHSTLRKLEDAAARVRPSTRVRSADRFLAVYTLYCRYGTLESAGRALGISRVRVRQMLVKGARWGLYAYPPPAPPEPPIEQSALREDFARLLTQRKVAQARGLSILTIKRLCKQCGITRADYEEWRRHARVERAKEEYRQLVAQLGHHPSTTELQSRNRGLAARILALWGSTSAFRKQQGVTDEDAYRHGKERVLARQGRWNERVRRFIEASGPSSVRSIARGCGLSRRHVRTILGRLIADDIVRRIRRSRACLYRLR
jgi:AraC-like DNA-binding protein